jgi:hypothetical protein
MRGFGEVDRDSRRTIKFASIIRCAVFLIAFAAVANAGVVVDEQQTFDQINGGKITRSRTVMIQGDKQKSIIDNGTRAVITDLGKGTVTMIDMSHKTYVELPFPPKPRSTTAMQGEIGPTISFKKTGGNSKLIGYRCEEYSGAGMVGGNSVSMSGCFSDSPPGATDYANFQRKMASKVKGTAIENMGQIPLGVPLRLTITTTIGKLRVSGLSPEQTQKLNQAMVNRRFVSDTTVSKISAKTLPDDSFQVPPGYVKQKAPQMSSTKSGSSP